MTKPEPKKAPLRGPDALFKTDPKLEQAGVWLDYGDFRIKIARAGANNQRFRQVFEAKTRPLRHAMKAETLSDEVAQRVTREVWAETIVLGWDSALGDNVIPYAGDRLPYSTENVLRLFTELPDLFTDIRDQSSQRTLFLQDLGTDLGN